MCTEDRVRDRVGARVSFRVGDRVGFRVRFRGRLLAEDRDRIMINAITWIGIGL